MAWMKVCRESNTVDVHFKRECAVKDDTQALDLRGGKNYKVVSGKGKTVRLNQSRFSAIKEYHC